MTPITIIILSVLLAFCIFIILLQRGVIKALREHIRNTKTIEFDEGNREILLKQVKRVLKNTKNWEIEIKRTLEKVEEFLENLKTD